MPDELPNLLNQLARRWREEGVEPGTGTTESEIASFEREYGVFVPLDLRLYLSTLNGMANEGDSDGSFVAFHGLTSYRLFFFTPPKQWQRVADYAGEQRPADAQLCFKIADWMIDDTIAGIFLPAHPQAVTPVYSLFNRSQQPIQIAANMAEFFQRCLAYDWGQMGRYFYGDIPA